MKINMEIKICDKCGKIIENYDKGKNTCTIRFMDIDICNDCGEALIKTLATVQNNYMERLKDRVLEAKEVVVKRAEVRENDK